MTVLENLQMGATVADPSHFAEDLKRVFTFFPLLEKRIGQRGGTLSGGEQQMLAIGRALMSRPRLLLLDEPSLGLAPLLAKQIFRAIRELNRREKLTVFLVEQNAFHALKLAHRGYVIVNGEITHVGQRPGSAGAARGARRLSRRRAALSPFAFRRRNPDSGEHRDHADDQIERDRLADQLRRHKAGDDRIDRHGVGDARRRRALQRHAPRG